MSLTVAVQMDPIELVDINADTTFVMIEEAQRRGHTVLYYHPNSLRYNNDAGVSQVFAEVQPVKVKRIQDQHCELGPAQSVPLDSVNVILMRQDPPFDMHYITATHLLDHVSDKALVVNPATAVRESPEKLVATHFPDLMPPTLITADHRAIRAFRAEHGDIIVKPLHGNGGAGVFHVKPDDENLGSILAMFDANSRDQLMVQRYLPAIRDGDKRIILIDGTFAGAINRLPAPGDARANMHAGGRAVAHTLSAREQEICARIGPFLRERGLLFVGIDVIGDHLTEINVTSPTGVQECNRLNGLTGPDRLEAVFWDAVERTLTAHE